MLQIDPVQRSIDPIPACKITPPAPRGISRPHLVARLDTATRGRLTVLSAPGGWGKTTAIAEWIAAADRPVAWLGLDAADNEPTRLFRGLAAAIDAIEPLGPGHLELPIQTTAALPAEHIDRILGARLAGVQHDVVIVLDDLHALTDPDLVAAIHRLILAAPANVHTVIGTRQDLPFPVARMRSTGDLTILKSQDLAFSKDEARDFLKSQGVDGLSESDLALLASRTEGWVSGLRLAGLALDGSRDMRHAVERFHGTHRDVSDYFREEVLGHLDPDFRRFLVESSVTNTFCAELCTAMMERSDAQAMIDHLESANLFLVPLDSDRHWYRYHALFHDLLVAEQESLDPQRLRDLRTRASTWFEQAFKVREAVELALAIPDHERVAGLIDRYAHILMFTCGESSLIVRWVELLDPEVVTARPRLVWAYAWSLTTVGRVQEAHALLDQYTLPSTSDHDLAQHHQALIAAVGARVAAYRGDQRAATVLGTRALELLDTRRNGRTHGDIVLSLGFAKRALGNTQEAAEHFAEAARLGRLHGNVQAARWGTRYLAGTRIAEGKLNEAEALVEEDLDRVSRESADPGGTLSALLVTRAEIFYLRRRLSEALAYSDHAIDLIHRVGDAKMLSNAYVIRARTLNALGEHDAALDTIRRSEDAFRPMVSGTAMAGMALAQGNLMDAARWAERSGFCLDDEPDSTRGEYEQETYARIMLAIEPGPASFALIDRLIAQAERDGRFGRSLELHLARTVASQEAGDTQAAETSLVRAIRLAQANGIVQPFFEHGEALRPLLRELARSNETLGTAERRFARTLIAEPVTPVGQADDSQPILEPLSERQREILTLLAEGAPNRVIADRLFIAEGTVKAHLHQLFGKLGARNRTEAVTTARDLRLLD